MKIKRPNISKFILRQFGHLLSEDPGLSVSLFTERLAFSGYL
jgi:hypothetical protein